MTKKASNKTKEIIREHGPEFYLLAQYRPIALGGDEGLHIRSVKTGWTGWIPLRELKKC